MFKAIRNKKNQKGFTLIELLVVIVIFGFLAAVAASRFLDAQDRAHVAATRGDLDLYRQALGMYEIDHGDYPHALTQESANQVVVDPQGFPYMLLPSVFGEFHYEYTKSPKPSYIITVRVLGCDSVLTATPAGIGDDAILGCLGE